MTGHTWRREVAGAALAAAGVLALAPPTASRRPPTDPPPLGLLADPGPDHHRTFVCRGRAAPSSPRISPSTVVVINWLRADEARYRHWTAAAVRCRREAFSEPRVDSLRSPEEVAARRLAGALVCEIAGGVPADTPDPYRQLLHIALGDTDWDVVALELLGDDGG